MFNPTLTPAQIQRFRDKVDTSGGPEACWPWRGGKDKGGYGRMKLRHKLIKAHRLAYFFAHGPIPDGLCVLHRAKSLVSSASVSQPSAKLLARESGNMWLIIYLNSQIWPIF